MTRDEAIAALREHGYGVVEDGAAVIVIDYSPHERITLSQTTATRFETPEAAVRELAPDEGRAERTLAR